MPFRIVRNDITRMKTDAIVNSANPEPVVGAGTDAEIYRAAGYEKLLEARKKIGKIKTGEAFFTEGFNLSAKYVIHTAGPYYTDGTKGEEQLLRNCYRNCLKTAYELGCKSISFPLISTGNYRYPKDKALNVALSEINSFLMETDFSNKGESYDMEVYLVIYDNESFDLSSKIYSDIQSYIDSNYIEQNLKKEYVTSDIDLCCRSILRESRTAVQTSCLESKQEVSDNLVELLKTKQEPFQDLLMRYIAERHLANKDVYKSANIDAKLFSKIICTKNYVPKKSNVMALAIGLKLNLDEAEQFLEAAGFAFSPCSQVDLIVKYFIQNQNYDMRDLEEKLYTLTGKTLGNLVE